MKTYRNRISDVRRNNNAKNNQRKCKRICYNHFTHNRLVWWWTNKKSRFAYRILQSSKDKITCKTILDQSRLYGCKKHRYSAKHTQLVFGNIYLLNIFWIVFGEGRNFCDIELLDYNKITCFALDHCKSQTNQTLCCLAILCHILNKQLAVFRKTFVTILKNDISPVIMR